ncbi:MAG: ABC transporter permease [Terriglobia bacterium]|jgi:predicted permease
MTTLIQDVKFGLRMLAKNPGFTTVAMLTLALGIGANAVIFSLINGLFLHPAGIADPVHLFAIRVKYQKLNLPSIVISAPDFADVRDSRQIFSSTAAENEEGFNYLAPEGPERLMAAKVTWEWFNAFGVRPLMGRVFQPEEDQPNANQVAVLAYATWQRLFGGDPSIVGKSIQLNHQDYRVVGVMGPDFDWPRRADVWVPLGLALSEFKPDNYFNENFFVVARARPDVSPSQAEAFVQVLTNRLIAAHPESTYAKDSGWGIFAIPFTEYGAGHLRTPMLILLGAVGFVLLIACSNIGGLILARASVRTREFAIRVALGAQKRDLLRQALTESFLLTAGGALLGIAGAYGGLGTFLRLAPGRLPPAPFIGIDGHVLLFAVALSFLTTIFLGVVPIGHIFGQEQSQVLKEEARSVTAGISRQRLRELLVVGQVALALVLLVGAGLLLKSLTRMARVDPGFDPSGVMTASVQLPEGQYNTDEKQAAFYRAVDEKLAALPGASSAAMAVALPFTGFTPSSSFDIEGRPLGPGDPGPHSDLNWITPGYFQAMRIPLLRGRYFTDQDRLGSQSVVVIDENLARQYWPHQDPVGQHLRRGNHSPWATIVGLVGHTMQSALVGDSGKGVCFYPLFQQPISQTFLIVKTNTDAGQMGNSLRAAVESIDPGQPVANLETMEQYVAGSLAPQRIAVILLAIFSFLAIFLASLGLYGVISYHVAQRTHEIGLRMALGAERRQVWRLVLAQGMRPALVGVLAGATVAAFFVRYLRSQLFSVSAFDPATFLLAGLVLLAVALIACSIPAWRATKVDPMVALRYE